MGRFKLTCCKCGSNNVLEKSRSDKVDHESNKIIYGRGIQRKCLDCDNEEFSIGRTWSEWNSDS